MSLRAILLALICWMLIPYVNTLITMALLLVFWFIYWLFTMAMGLLINVIAVKLCESAYMFLVWEFLHAPTRPLRGAAKLLLVMRVLSVLFWALVVQQLYLKPDAVVRRHVRRLRR
jgi:hypothetical protein